MGKPFTFDESQSISAGRLISPHTFIGYFDRFCFYIGATFSIICSLLLESTIKYDGIFSAFLIFFFAPFLLFFAAYSIYRKINEQKLIQLQTGFTKKRNIEALNAFLEKFNYTISEESENIILVIDEYMLSYNGIWRKKYVFIISDFYIYFNIQKLYPVIAPPVLFSHLILKHDLKKFLLNYNS